MSAVVLMTRHSAGASFAGRSCGSRSTITSSVGSVRNRMRGGSFFTSWPFCTRACAGKARFRDAHGAQRDEIRRLVDLGARAELDHAVVRVLLARALHRDRG